MRRIAFALLLLAASGAAPAGAQQTEVFRGATLLPISGAPIENGVLVVRDGKIVALGRADEVRVPEGAIVHDAAGKVIMPGLVDTHSHIGGGRGATAPPRCTRRCASWIPSTRRTRASSGRARAGSPRST